MFQKLLHHKNIAVFKKKQEPICLSKIVFLVKPRSRAQVEEMESLAAEAKKHSVEYNERKKALQ